MSDEPFDAVKNIQTMIDMEPPMVDGKPDMSMAPPFVRGMDLTGLKFIRVAKGEFDMEWMIVDRDFGPPPDS